MGVIIYTKTIKNLSKSFASLVFYTKLALLNHTKTREHMDFTKNINELFLKGGQVISGHTYTAKTYLIRMPKNSFIKHEDGREFEFVWIQNYHKDDILHIGGWFNGTLIEAKKHAAEQHKEYCTNIYRLRRIKEEKVKSQRS